MGWFVCGCIMVYWWLCKECGEIVLVWNVVYNVGGGLIGFIFLFGLWMFNDDWCMVFYVFVFFVVLVVVFIWLVMCDIF